MSYTYNLDHVQTYLQSHFLILAKLAAEAHVSESEIHDLVRTGCIPGPTYTSRVSVIFSSSQADPVEVDDHNMIEYYHPSTVEWIAMAENLANEIPDRNLIHLSRLMRFHFEAEFALALIEYPAAQFGYREYFLSENELSRAKFHELVVEEWSHVVKGFYGKCLKIPVSARAIVRKGVVSSQILNMTDHFQKEVLTDQERCDLIKAMNEFNVVVSEFSPHDRTTSSRKRFFDDLITKYGLQDHFQRHLYPQTPMRDFKREHVSVRH